MVGFGGESDFVVYLLENLLAYAAEIAFQCKVNKSAGCLIKGIVLVVLQGNECLLFRHYFNSLVDVQGCSDVSQLLIYVFYILVIGPFISFCDVFPQKLFIVLFVNFIKVSCLVRECYMTLAEVLIMLMSAFTLFWNWSLMFLNRILSAGTKTHFMHVIINRRKRLLL